jgi:ATP synthase protein I
MAGPEGQGKSDLSKAESQPAGDFDRRLRDLDHALGQKRPNAKDEADGAAGGKTPGLGNALRLSSEFIAAIIVGAGLGWIIDSLAGTSPFGLIVLLLIGFAAGILNVLRAAGQVAEFGAARRDGDGGPKAK